MRNVQRKTREQLEALALLCQIAEFLCAAFSLTIGTSFFPYAISKDCSVARFADVQLSRAGEVVGMIS